MPVRVRATVAAAVLLAITCGFRLQPEGWRLQPEVVSAAGQERASARDVWAEYLPPGAGKDITVKACGNCHGLERIVKLRMPREKWDSTVLDMIGRGAPIFIDEADAVIAYLGTNLSPKAPPLVDVNEGTKDDLIKIPGITAAHADTLLAARKAAPLTRDRLREVLGMDEKAFEGVRYYLFVAPPSGRS
jgi:mono/diheme cytochrome c family protein